MYPISVSCQKIPKKCLNFNVTTCTQEATPYFSLFSKKFRYEIIVHFACFSWLLKIKTVFFSKSLYVPNENARHMEACLKNYKVTRSFFSFKDNLHSNKKIPVTREMMFLIKIFKAFGIEMNEF